MVKKGVIALQAGILRAVRRLIWVYPQNRQTPAAQAIRLQPPLAFRLCDGRRCYTGPGWDPVGTVLGKMVLWSALFRRVCCEKEVSRVPDTSRKDDMHILRFVDSALLTVIPPEALVQAPGGLIEINKDLFADRDFNNP